MMDIREYENFYDFAHFDILRLEEDKIQYTVLNISYKIMLQKNSCITSVRQFGIIQVPIFVCKIVIT